MSTLENVESLSVHDTDSLTQRLLALPDVIDVAYVGLGTSTARVDITCTCNEPNSVVADVTRASKLTRRPGHRHVSTALCVKPRDNLIRLTPV